MMDISGFISGVQKIKSNENYSYLLSVEIVLEMNDYGDRLEKEIDIYVRMTTLL